MRNKAKTLQAFLFLVLALFVGLHCKKTSDTTEQLPPATQQGKNTFGFKFNGEVWLPNIKCGYFSSPCGALALTVLPSNNVDSLPVALSLSAARKNSSTSSFLQFVTKGISNPPTSYFSKIGNIFDSLDIEYSTSGLKIFYTRPDHPGHVDITKLDIKNQIISGQFAFTLFNGQDSVVISDGRFDLKFGACLCYN